MPSQNDYSQMQRDAEAYSAVEGRRRGRGGVSSVAIAIAALAVGGVVVYAALGRSNRSTQDAAFDTIPFEAPQEKIEPPRPVVDNSKIQIPMAPPSAPPKPQVAEAQPPAPVVPPQPPAILTPAPIIVDTPPLPAQPPMIEAQKIEQEKQLAAVKAKADDDARWARLRANSIVNDASSGNEKSPDDPAKAASDAADKEDDQNIAFLSSHSKQKVQVEKADKIDRTDALIPSGTLIHGVLETAIQSDLAGSIRATTSEDVFSFDGRRVLIPAGTRLIGEYKSGIKTGQTRVFVIWTRMLTPDGVSANLGSTGTDVLGRGGMTGDVDNHYAERFGAATALTFIGAGASFLSGWGFGAGGQSSQTQTTITNPDGTTTTLTTQDLSVQARQKATDATAQSLTKMAEDTLQEYIKIPPTIHVDQGEPIVIFVRRDLDFSALYPDPVIEALRQIKRERRASALPQ